MKKRKKQIANLLKLGVFLFGISLLLWNCEKDKTHDYLENNLEANSSLQAEWLGVDELPENVFQTILSSFQNKSIYNKTSSFNQITTDSVVRIIDSLNFKKYSFKSGISSDINNFYFENYIVAQDPNNNIATYTVRYTPKKEWLLKNEIANLVNFSGNISYYKDDGSLFWEVELIDGEVNSYVSNKHSIAKNTTSLSGKQYAQEVSVYITYEDCHCHTTHAASGCTHPITVVNISGGGSPDIPYHSGGGSQEPADPSAPDFGGGSSTPINSLTTKETYIWYINECLSTGESLNSFLNKLHISKLYSLNTFLQNNNCNNESKGFAALALEAWDKDGTDDGEVDFDEQIINNLTGKAKCVYEKLKAMSTDFKNMIQKFDGEFPVSHLKFEMRDLGTRRAQTDAPDGAGGNNSPDYVITIALNSNSNEHGVSYRPNLMNVKTIAHEVIHAEMYRKLLSVLDNGGNIAGVTKEQFLNVKNNFPGLYDYYTRYNFNTSTPNNAQHQQMATHYRETLARILQAFDTGTIVPDNQQPQQLYMDLAWEGLRYEGTTGNNAIYTWTSLSQAEKDRIEDVIDNYIEANKNENCQ